MSVLVNQQIKAKPMSTLSKIIKWIVILSFPFLLGFGTVRTIIASDYPAFEYPRIAPDAYGWSAEERLALGNATLDYIQRPEPAEEVIYLLKDMRLPEDQATPVYNESEIGHMIDVKILFDGIGRVLRGLMVIVPVGLASLFFINKTEFYETVYKGGWATVILLASIAIFILVGWTVFFTLFHELLFPPGTWTFYYTDSLIRLFPEKFWFDVGAIISIGTLLEGVIVMFIGRYLVRSNASTKPQKS
ncbi:MAG: integral membrane protein (TIGR01906 family) [Cellvibrionaceae bacterium]